MGAIGRNDRCPCGSGNKFKKCCLPSASADDMARMVSSEKLRQRVQKRDPFNGDRDSIFVQDSKGVRKMSEIILEFARPYLDEVDSFDDYKKVIPMAMIAWNLGLTDESEMEVQLAALCNDLGHSMTDDLAIEFRQRVSALVYRKRQHFSEVKRLVMDWDIVEMGNSFHLNVVSTLIDGDLDTKEFESKAGKLLESTQSIQV